MNLLMKFFDRLCSTVLISSLLFSYNAVNAQKNNVSATRFDSMKIISGHPRIWVDADRLHWLKEKCKGKSADEVMQMAGPSVAGLSLTYLITGSVKHGKEAIRLAMNKYIDPGSIYTDLKSPDGENKRVHIQSNLFDQALCYDWCYSLLSATEKLELRNLMVPRMKEHQNFKRAWRSLHNGMYDNAWPLTAGILALYGDEPYAQEAFDFIKPELEDAMKTFDLLFPDGEWGEGMDYNRHSTYPALRIFLALKTATGVDVIANSPHFKNTIPYIIYSVKPNGLALPDDDNDWPYLGEWEHAALLMLNAEYKDGYAQYFINRCPVQRFKLEPAQQYNRLLWYDASIKEKPINQLPLSRIFRGKGLVIARSNWGWDKPGKRANDTWLSFHCGDYFGDHVHYDINSFSLYHKGELAIDAGRYDSDWEVSEDSARIIKSQFFNYYQRTIAHNTILVKEPGEKMNLNIVNDGGQLVQLRKNGIRNVPEDYEQGHFPSDTGNATCDWVTNPGRWETGNITSYKATDDFMYVRGDGTKAYAASKMNSFIRQLLFLQPDIIVVMDKVVSTNPDFKKTWLLHSVNEPVFHKGSNNFELINEEGRLVCTPVLPRKINLSKIGGPGNEFLVDTTRYKCGLNSVISPTELHYGEIPGAWRVEINPSDAAREDYFLNVIQVSGKNLKTVPAIKIVTETDSNIIVQVKGKDETLFEMNFTKDANPSLHLKITKKGRLSFSGNMPDDIELEKGRDR